MSDTLFSPRIDNYEWIKYGSGFLNILVRIPVYLSPPWCSVSVKLKHLYDIV